MKNANRNGGFSLIEVMIATMILGGAIVVLAAAWSGNFGRLKNARINNTMAMLLERKMTEYEVIIKEKSIKEIKDEESGDFGAKFPGYRWEMKSQAFEMPSMTGALTADKEGADSMVLMIVDTVGKFIKEVVREMSVTVYFKGSSGKEVRHTATTYLVDYTKEMPVPGMPGGAGMPGGGEATGQ
jgi:general secretion pathway protein I